MRFIIYWFTIVLGMVLLLAFAGLLFVASEWVGRATGSTIAGLMTMLVISSLAAAGVMFYGLSTERSQRLGEFLQRLERR